MTALSQRYVVDMNRLLHQPTLVAANARSHQLPVDVLEYDDRYELVAEVPGVERENIDLRVEQGVLVLEAKLASTGQDDDQLVWRKRERRQGVLTRRFDLNGSIQESDIQAELNHGLLKVIAPKRAAERSLNIEIH